MSNFDKALQKFGRALENLKGYYAIEFGVDPNYLSIIIDENDNMTIIPTTNMEGHIHCYRKSVIMDDYL